MHDLARAPARLGDRVSDLATIHAAGQVLGEEARGLHNMFLHAQNNRGESCNGLGSRAVQFLPNGESTRLRPLICTHAYV